MIQIKGKLLDYSYLPITLLLSVAFLIIHGWSSWLEALALAGGLILGWFFLSFYVELFSLPRLNIIFHSLAFQAIFLIFSFWLTISSDSLLASGITIGINLFFLKELIFDYQNRQPFLRKRLFNDLEVGPNASQIYLIIFALLIAFLIILVLL